MLAILHNNVLILVLTLLQSSFMFFFSFNHLIYHPIQMRILTCFALFRGLLKLLISRSSQYSEKADRQVHWSVVITVPKTICLRVWISFTPTWRPGNFWILIPFGSFSTDDAGSGNHELLTRLEKQTERFADPGVISHVSDDMHNHGHLQLRMQNCRQVMDSPFRDRKKTSSDE